MTKKKDFLKEALNDAEEVKKQVIESAKTIIGDRLNVDNVIEEAVSTGNDQPSGYADEDIDVIKKLPTGGHLK